MWWFGAFLWRFYRHVRLGGDPGVDPELGVSHVSSILGMAQGCPGGTKNVAGERDV